jgi:dienelactone hydrolase
MPRSTPLRETLELDFGGDERVPAIFQCPPVPTATPGVLLLHGFSSRKERVADSIGRQLAALGVSSLATDLPLHGARADSADRIEETWLRHPLALAQQWKLAVHESQMAIRYLATRPEIDASRIAIAGYSLGAFLATVVAAENSQIRFVALVAGGDLPSNIPFAPLVRKIAGPVRAIRSLNGRPLFMMNGRRDRTVTPAQAQALFDAAQEPKQLHWYDGGHWPPESSLASVAEWLASQLVGVAARRGSA